jgi:hypothetical protein
MRCGCLLCCHPRSGSASALLARLRLLFLLVCVCSSCSSASALLARLRLLFLLACACFSCLSFPKGICVCFFAFPFRSAAEESAVLRTSRQSIGCPIHRALRDGWECIPSTRQLLPLPVLPNPSLKARHPERRRSQSHRERRSRRTPTPSNLHKPLAFFNQQTALAYPCPPTQIKGKTKEH